MMTKTLVPRSWWSDLPRDFDEVFDGILGTQLAGSPRPWWPAVETYTKDGEIHARLDLPGVDPKEVEVTLDGTTLSVRGERKSESETENGYREVHYGRFERQMTVPRGIDPEKVKARYENGVLEISAPLPAALRPRKVPVQIERQEEERKAA